MVFFLLEIFRLMSVAQPQQAFSPAAARKGLSFSFDVAAKPQHQTNWLWLFRAWQLCCTSK
jgi:hypothetical protein